MTSEKKYNIFVLFFCALAITLSILVTIQQGKREKEIKELKHKTDSLLIKYNNE